MDKEQSVDLADFNTATEQGFEFQVFNPKGEPIDFFIEVVGSDSDTYQTTYKALQKRMAERVKRSGRNSISPDEVEANALELLIAATRKWRGSVKVNGEPLPPCTPDNVRKVYKGWRSVREQSDVAIHERSNFLPQPAKS